MASVASVFVSRWDSAVAADCAGRAAQPARHRHGEAHLQGVPVRSSARRAGSASTTPAPGRSGCCGPAPAPRIPKASDVMYIKALAAPFTVNTIPEATLNALADHGELSGLLLGRRRRLRGGAGAVRRRRRGSAGARGPAADRRRRVVRQVVALVDGGDRVEERRAHRDVAQASSRSAGLSLLRSHRRVRLQPDFARSA